jgi:RNase adaptor protein for sRNA GlmZ degradation
MAVFWVESFTDVSEVLAASIIRAISDDLHNQGDDSSVLMMEAESTSETLVNFYQTTRRYNPEEHCSRTMFLNNADKHSMSRPKYLFRNSLANI